jgi:hypothetical protein
MATVAALRGAHRGDNFDWVLGDRLATTSTRSGPSVPTSRPAPWGFPTSSTDAVARFGFEVSGGSWWWSEEMFHLHGYGPAEVVPSTKLMRRTSTRRTGPAPRAG